MRDTKKSMRISYGTLGMALLVIEILGVVLAPIIAPFSPTRQFYNAMLQGPSAQHWFGTDSLGQDVLSQVIWGGRISLLLGLAVTVLSGIGGLTLGFLSLARRMDFWTMRVVDAIMSFPPILLALAIIGAVGSGLWTEIVVISIAFAPYNARIVRSEVLRLRSMPFVEAADALGASPLRVMLHHLLPNSRSAIVVQMTFVFSRAIVLDAALGYLGLGVPPPTPTWGTLIANSQPYLATAWWAWLAPSMAIIVTTVLVSIVGKEFGQSSPRLMTEMAFSGEEALPETIVEIGSVS